MSKLGRAVMWSVAGGLIVLLTGPLVLFALLFRDFDDVAPGSLPRGQGAGKAAAGRSLRPRSFAGLRRL
jgi:hypothetical protein